MLLRRFAASRQYATAVWQKVPLGPPDPILGVTTAFLNDKNPNKINLGVGAYRDANGKPFILDCVKEVDRTGCRRRFVLKKKEGKKKKKKKIKLTFSPSSGSQTLDRVGPQP
jgi:aspartate/tyrosine/aromatic aminotransferase